MIVPSDSKGDSRNLTVGDLMHIDFENILERDQPTKYYVHYSTVKGDALGKLILTDYEIIFDPLNSKLKGFIHPE